MASRVFQGCHTCLSRSIEIASRALSTGHAPPAMPRRGPLRRLNGLKDRTGHWDRHWRCVYRERMFVALLVVMLHWDHM
jgi:hypothetical protein